MNAWKLDPEQHHLIEKDNVVKDLMRQLGPLTRRRSKSFYETLKAMHV